MDGNNPFSSCPSSRERECGHFDESRTGPLAQHGREFPTRLPVMLTKPSDAKALLPGPESQLHVAFCCHNQFHGMWSIRTLVFYPVMISFFTPSKAATETGEHTWGRRAMGKGASWHTRLLVGWTRASNSTLCAALGSSPWERLFLLHPCLVWSNDGIVHVSV